MTNKPISQKELEAYFYSATYVSWDDAVAYCKKLSEKERQDISLTHRSGMGVCLSGRNQDSVELWR